MSVLRIGLAGSGEIARRTHAPLLTTLPGVELAAIAGGRDRARAADLARDFGIPAVCDDALALCARPDLDAIVVALPNALHAPVTLAALARGLHVLCEKPLATSAGDAARMVDAARRGGRVLALHHPLRAHPGAVEFRRRSLAADLGALRTLRLRLYRRAGIPGHGSWFTRRAHAGAGALFDLGSHLVDFALWIAGPPRVGSLWARCWADFGREGRGAGSWGVPEARVDADAGAAFDVDDRALLGWTTAQGVVVDIDVAWAIGAADELRFEARCAGGGVELAPAHFGVERPLRVFGPDARCAPLEPAGLAFDAASFENASRTLLGQFVDAIRRNVAPLCPGADGRATQLVLEAALAANRGPTPDG